MAGVSAIPINAVSARLRPCFGGRHGPTEPEREQDEWGTKWLNKAIWRCPVSHTARFSIDAEGRKTGRYELDHSGGANLRLDY